MVRLLREVLIDLNALTKLDVILAKSAHLGHDIAHGPGVNFPLLCSFILVLLEEIVVWLERGQHRDLQINLLQHRCRQENDYRLVDRLNRWAQVLVLIFETHRHTLSQRVEPSASEAH